MTKLPSHKKAENEVIRWRKMLAMAREAQALATRNANEYEQRLRDAEYQLSLHERLEERRVGATP